MFCTADLFVLLFKKLAAFRHFHNNQSVRFNPGVGLQRETHQQTLKRVSLV